MDKEIWKETGILGTSVSNYGRIKRNDGYIYKLQINKSNGYKYVNLSKNNKTLAYKVARLVAIAFIPNPENKNVSGNINACINGRQKPHMDIYGNLRINYWKNN